MVNPDGVFLGNNRCNLIGQDLNRCWNIATEFSHPTIVAAKNMLRDIDNSDVSIEVRRGRRAVLFSVFYVLECMHSLSVNMVTHY